MPKKANTKPTDAEQVATYMEALDHPLKEDMETLMKVVQKADARLSERIKWNAPSYYYKEDIVTFGPLRTGKLFLVFHHPSIMNIKSEILEGDFKDRRLAYFNGSADIKTKQAEVKRIISETIAHIERNA